MAGNKAILFLLAGCLCVIVIYVASVAEQKLQLIDVHHGFFSPSGPEYEVISDRRQLDEVASRVWGLKAIDDELLMQFVLVVAVDEVRPTSGYDIRISAGLKSSGRITLRITHTQPEPGSVVNQVQTSPVHIVGIARDQLLQDEYVVFFVDEYGAILRTTRLVLK